MKTHELKVWPEFFDALASGEKTFELRFDDRGFRVGDRLRLREWSKAVGYSGREVSREVTYLVAGLPWLQPDHVCMALGTPGKAIPPDLAPASAPNETDKRHGVSISKPPAPVRTEIRNGVEVTVTDFSERLAEYRKLGMPETSDHHDPAGGAPDTLSARSPDQATSASPPAPAGLVRPPMPGKEPNE